MSEKTEKKSSSMKVSTKVLSIALGIVMAAALSPFAAMAETKAQSLSAGAEAMTATTVQSAASTQTTEQASSNTASAATETASSATQARQSTAATSTAPAAQAASTPAAASTAQTTSSAAQTEDSAIVTDHSFGSTAEAVDGSSSALTVQSDTASAGSCALTPQSYASTRTVEGTPLDTSAKLIAMGERKAADTWNGVYSGRIGDTMVNDTIVDHFEFHLPNGTQDAAYFSSDYIYLEWNFNEGGDERDTGWSTNYLYKLSDRSTWPANLRDGLTIVSWTDTDIVLDYTYSQAEKEWALNHKHNSWQILVKPMVYTQKMPDTTEAAYVPYTATDHLLDMTTGEEADIQYSYDLTYLTDKKTVEINQQIAPVAADGTVGTYTNDTVSLEAEQAGSVKDTLSRPVGVLDSGDCQVSCTIPDGMTYVAGSATATTTSGITVTLDDSSGVPVVDFSALPVGSDTVTVTFRVKAPSTVTTYKEFPTSDTLTNLYQKNLKSNNLFTDTSLRRQPVYAQSEYDTTVSNVFSVGAVTPAGTVDKSIAKTWSDSDNASGARPASITVHLYADGTDTGKTLTLNADNGWKGVFSEIDKYNASGSAIDYTVTEDAVSGYTAAITDDGEGDAFTVQNTLASEPGQGGKKVVPNGSSSDNGSSTVDEGETINSDATPLGLPKTGDPLDALPFVGTLAAGAAVLAAARRRGKDDPAE